MNSSSQIPERYNVRVYGLWINENSEVLVTDEYRLGVKMTKFPGGGNEFGEGLGNTVIREFKEELNIEVAKVKLLYINDFLQTSAFNSREQLLSVYYQVKPVGNPVIVTASTPFDFPELVEGAQVFRWISLRKIHPDHFTFPIDKKVATLLAKEYQD